MAQLKASMITLIGIVLIAAFCAAALENESKLKPDEVLPSIVTKIVRRGLVPKRSRLVSSTEIPESVDPPKATLTQTDTTQRDVSKSVYDNKSLNHQPQQLQCTSNEGHSNATEALIAYDEFKCTNNNNNGEYLHNIELIDGTRHKEEGLVIDGHFTIRGFFFSNQDPKHYHIYIKDTKGFHYYLVPVMNVDGTQEYGIGDEDDEICSVRGDSCIDPKILASMLG